MNLFWGVILFAKVVLACGPHQTNASGVCSCADSFVNVSGSCLCEAGKELVHEECLPCPLHRFSDKPNLGQCYFCNPGSLTLEVGSQSCFCATGFYADEGDCWPCPPYGVCLGGSNAPVAAPGAYAFANSPYFYACPIPEACLGGNFSECAEGYEGILCASCSENYSNVGQRCLHCSPAALSVFLIVLVLGIIAWFIFATKPQWIPAFVRPEKDTTSIQPFVRIFFTYFQLGITVSAYFPSNSTRELFEAFAFVNADVLRLVNAECLGTQGTYLGRFVAITLVPVVGILFGFIRWGYLKRKRGSEELKMMKDTVFRGVAFFITIMYNAIVFAIVGLFDARAVFDGKEDKLWLVRDYQVEYAGERWWAVFPWALICLVIYVVGFPSLVGWLLRRHRSSLLRLQSVKKMDEEEGGEEEEVEESDLVFARRWGFLFSAYHSKANTHELWHFLRDFLVIGILPFMDMDGTFTVWCLIGFWVVHAAKAPYEETVWNVSEHILFGSLVSALLFSLNGPCNASPIFHGLLSLSVLLPFVVFGAWIFLLILRHVKKRRERPQERQ